MPLSPSGLLGEVHDGEPADPACIAGLDVIEVHTACDNLVIAVQQVPGGCPVLGDRVVLDDLDQDAA